LTLSRKPGTISDRLNSTLLTKIMLEPTHSLSIELDSNPADRQVIGRGIDEYNTKQAGDMNDLPLAVFIRDGDGQVIAGLLGDTYWGWLSVNLLWVEAAWRGRGYGRALLRAAEQEAIQRGCATLGTIVAIGSAPIFAGILGWLVRGERPTQRWLLATAGAVAGCTLLVIDGADLVVNALGVLLALAAGASYAVYALSSKELVETLAPAAVSAVAFLGGALLLAPLLFFLDLHWLGQPRGLLVALHLGLLATAAAYTLYVHALRRVPTATAVTLSLAEPVVAATLGVVVLGERLGWMAGIGILLLLFGLSVLTLQRSA
jgi:DME family drug/metabolite transporter